MKKTRPTELAERNFRRNGEHVCPTWLLPLTCAPSCTCQTTPRTNKLTTQHKLGTILKHNSHYYYNLISNFTALVGLMYWFLSVWRKSMILFLPLLFCSLLNSYREFFIKFTNHAWTVGIIILEMKVSFFVSLYRINWKWRIQNANTYHIYCVKRFKFLDKTVGSIFKECPYCSLHI